MLPFLKPCPQCPLDVEGMSLLPFPEAGFLGQRVYTNYVSHRVFLRCFVRGGSASLWLFVAMTASLGPCMDGMLCVCDQRGELGNHRIDRCMYLRPPSLSLDSSAEPRDWGNLQTQPCQAPRPPTSFLGHAPFWAPPSCSFARPLLSFVAPPPTPWPRLLLLAPPSADSPA